MARVAYHWVAVDPEKGMLNVFTIAKRGTFHSVTELYDAVTTLGSASTTRLDMD